MDKGLKLLLGFFCTMILLLIALGNLAMIMDLPTYRLTLTGEGCAYAQSIPLPVEKGSGQCSVVVRFQPHAISKGGLLYLNDGQTIDVTETMLLATAMVDTSPPLTPAQRDRLKWLYVWLGMAIASGSATFIYWRMK